MEQPHSQPPPSELIPRPDAPTEHMRSAGGLRFSRVGTLAATTVAFVLTEAPLEVPVHLPLYTSESNHEVSASDQTGTEAGDGAAVVEQKIINRDRLTVSQEKWARLFSKDEDAGILTGHPELTRVIDKIDQAHEHGFAITEVNFQGSASAEDATVNATGRRTAGLTAPSEDNTKLANLRAHKEHKDVNSELAHDGTGIPPETYSAPIEDFLELAEVKHTRFLAKKYGYHDTPERTAVDQLVEDYNRHQGSPEDVKAYLDEILAKERKVIVTITSEKELPAIFGAIGRVNIPSAHEPPQTLVERHHHNLDLTLPLLFLIPLWRRRRGKPIEPAYVDQATLHNDLPRPALLPSKFGYTPSSARPDLQHQNTPSNNFTDEPVQIPRNPLPGGRRAKDAAFGGGPDQTRSGHSVVALQRKQPRPHNMHGHTAGNSHVARDSGGSRPSQAAHSRSNRGVRK